MGKLSECVDVLEGLMYAIGGLELLNQLYTEEKQKPIRAAITSYIEELYKVNLYLDKIIGEETMRPYNALREELNA